jgi:hypothetical protein
MEWQITLGPDVRQIEREEPGMLRFLVSSDGRSHGSQRRSSRQCPRDKSTPVSRRREDVSKDGRGKTSEHSVLYKNDGKLARTAGAHFVQSSAADPSLVAAPLPCP